MNMELLIPYLKSLERQATAVGLLETLLLSKTQSELMNKYARF